MTYDEAYDILQQSEMGNWEDLTGVLQALLDYTGSVEARELQQSLPPLAAPAKPVFNYISLRHRSAREFTDEVTELLNEGWEFAAPFAVAAGVSDRDDLWVAFLRREASND